MPEKEKNDCLSDDELEGVTGGLIEDPFPVVVVFGDHSHLKDLNLPEESIGKISTTVPGVQPPAGEKTADPFSAIDANTPHER